MTTPAVNIFGGGYQRAAKEHTCWLCGETIAKGEGYFRTAGVSVGGYLAREAGESGILSLWNANESTAIPIVQIREWKIRPVQPAQDEAA